MSPQITSELQRVMVYVDGFNLYFGMKSAGLRKYSWLNVRLLAQHILKANQQLEKVKYFTSRVGKDPEKERRQAVFIDALGTLERFEIIYGQYHWNKIKCTRCFKKWRAPNEKMTDVNIAVELLADAQLDAFDTAIIVSGDSDLSGVVEKLRLLHPYKRVIMAFPPNRKSNRLRKLAHGYTEIGEDLLSRSLFSDPVMAGGFALHCPERWKDSAKVKSSWVRDKLVFFTKRFWRF